jgi:hypothetical protein
LSILNVKTLAVVFGTTVHGKNRHGSVQQISVFPAKIQTFSDSCLSLRGLSKPRPKYLTGFLSTDSRNLAPLRRKIRLIESKAKCCYLKKLTCKGTSRQVFYLSEAPSLPMIPYSTHTYTLYKCIVHLQVYLFTQGRGGGELIREKVKEAIVHKTGRKCQHDLYIQSINSTKHQ